MGYNEFFNEKNALQAAENNQESMIETDLAAAPGILGYLEEEAKLLLDLLHEVQDWTRNQARFHASCMIDYMCAGFCLLHLAKTSRLNFG